MLREIIRTGNTVTEKKIVLDTPVSSTTSAAFNNGIHEVQINTYVYNGKKDLKKKSMKINKQ